MDARAKTVREILHSGDQYIIPLFQRHYSWTKKHWKRLWADTNALFDGEKNDQHFLGPLVCTPVRSIPTEVPGYQLIDGQQRLTTLSVMLAAIRDVARERGFTDLADEIKEDYLIHKRKKGTDRYKVLPRLGDRNALMAVIEGDNAKEFRHFNVVHAWRFFYGLVKDIESEGAEARLRRMFSTISSQLSLVVITIEGENPYEIFESLNSTGLPLEESDLIRNYVFMNVPLADQEEFHSEHWKPFEKLFDETEQGGAIPQTAFYRNYVMHNGTYSSKRATFVDFKKQHRASGLPPEAQVAELKRYAGFELLFRRPQLCEDKETGRRLNRISMLDITTAHPLLMRLMELHESEQLPRPEFLGCLDDLASFVLRRSICGETTRQYGKWFTEAIRSIRENARADLRAYWLKRGWPDDAAFQSGLVRFPIYRREHKKCRLLLEELERSFGHKETVDFASLSIEHVMPQTIKGKAASDWETMLGSDWADVHEKWLHTLGNLTLSGYNPELGNRSYHEKQSELVRSKLSLNEYFESVAAWNAQAIQGRGESLAKRVADLWPRPEGQPYVATVSVGQNKITSHERGDLQLRFWTQLLDRPDLPKELLAPPKPGHGRRIRFRVGRSGATLCAIVNHAKKRMGVALCLRGKNREDRFESLYGEKVAIEREIGQSLTWQSETGLAESQVICMRLNVQPLDESQWSQHFDWFADTLGQFCKTFLKRIPSKKRRNSERGLSSKRQTYQEYWDRLHQLLEESGPVKPRKALAQNWSTFKLGRVGLHLHAMISVERQHIRVGVTLFGHQAKARFSKLMRQKAEIESEVDQPLDWEEMLGHKESRIALRKHDVDPLDESDWTEQHKWIAQYLAIFFEVFSPRIKDLD